MALRFPFLISALFVDSGLTVPLSPTPASRGNVSLHLFRAHSCYARRSSWNDSTALDLFRENWRQVQPYEVGKMPGLWQLQSWQLPVFANRGWRKEGERAKEQERGSKRVKREREDSRWGSA